MRSYSLVYVFVFCIFLSFPGNLCAQSFTENLDAGLGILQQSTDMVSSAIIDIYHRVSEVISKSGDLLRQVGKGGGSMEAQTAWDVAEPVFEHAQVQDLSFPEISGDILQSYRSTPEESHDSLYATLHLKTGETVRGLLVEKEDDYVRISVDDAYVTFFAEEILGLEIIPE